ncbi:MAG TPA: glutamine synthetase family protein [Actinomycetota bacterium]|jgi:glutamine synthetase|nr:glutamine synthetase family protein [Actinomycetota bacterium]
MAEVEQVLEDWRKDGIGYVRFELPDMHGISRSKTIPIAHATDYASRGLNMYGGTSVLDSRSDVVPSTLYHEERGYGDQLLFPDPNSATVIPWADRTARFICDATWYDGQPLAATPRHVFRRALEKARSMGFEPVMGSEFEFYLLTPETHEPLFSGYQIFNTVRNDYVPTIRRILDEMPQAGVDIITSNCEYAGSQWEINFAPGSGLAGPDDAFTFKNGVKEIAKQDGYLATFMSKPWSDSAGSGCHTHLSLVNAESGENAFGDPDAADGLTEAARSFIGGLLKYAREIDAVIAPTVNCLRRRRRHTFSPTNISWGQEDRSALVRVKGGTPESRHVEYRAPSALSNPYLVGAALIQAGLRGIEEGLPAPEPSKPGVPAEDDDSFEKLPTDLEESLDALEQEPAAKEFFGEEFVAAYTTMRRYELSRFKDAVSDWERTEYLELF